MFEGAPPIYFVFVLLCGCRGRCYTFPLRPQKHFWPRQIALRTSDVRRWGNHQGRSLNRRHDASALRPESSVRRPGNMIRLAYVITRWLVTMDPAGRGVMRQRFGGNVVRVGAPSEGMPEKHGRVKYLSQPLRERCRRLPPVHVLISMHISPARGRETGRSMWYE